MPKGGWREQGGPEDLAGLLYDLGSHLVDQALQLLGPVTSVYAEADVRREECGPTTTASSPSPTWAGPGPTCG